MATFTYEKVETNSIPKATAKDETFFAAEPGIEDKAQEYINDIGSAVNTLAQEVNAFATALTAEGVWTGDSANDFKTSIVRQGTNLNAAYEALSTAAEGIKDAIEAHENGEKQARDLVNK